MDLPDLYTLFVQYRTDSDQPDVDGKYLDEFRIAIEEILSEVNQ